MTRQEQMREALRLYEEDNQRMIEEYENTISEYEREQAEKEAFLDELGICKCTF